MFDKVFYCLPKICINHCDLLTTSSKCINVVMIVELQRFYSTACVIQPPFDAPLIVVNYFYHEEVKKSADM